MLQGLVIRLHSKNVVLKLMEFAFLGKLEVVKLKMKNTNAGMMQNTRKYKAVSKVTKNSSVAKNLILNPNILYHSSGYTPRSAY